eukprot:jgi/Bigna1/128934/aug1.7_g3642
MPVIYDLRQGLLTYFLRTSGSVAERVGKRKLFPIGEQRKHLELFKRPRPTVYVADYKEPIDYGVAWDWQKEIIRQRVKKEADEDMLLVLQHPQVYTLGRGSSTEHVKFDPENSEIKLYRTERGGEVTCHAPGQIVMYPIIDLRRYHKDLHWYLFQLEEVIINALRKFEIEGKRDSEHTGVWVGTAKIAAVGINVTRWWSMHGLALNVDNQLEDFDRITPCGIEDRQVCSVTSLNPEVTYEEVRKEMLLCFEDLFNCELSAAQTH